MLLLLLFVQVVHAWPADLDVYISAQGVTVNQPLPYTLELPFVQQWAQAGDLQFNRTACIKFVRADATVNPHFLDVQVYPSMPIMVFTPSSYYAPAAVYVDTPPPPPALTCSCVILTTPPVYLCVYRNGYAAEPLLLEGEIDDLLLSFASLLCEHHSQDEQRGDV